VPVCPQSSSSRDTAGGGLPADWTENFNLYDPGYLADPYAVWAAMRTECPVARTDRHGGGYLPSRHADITAAALDPGTFSSRAGEVTGPVPDAGRELKLPPVTSDPPQHADDRRLLVPLFTRQAVARYEELTRATAARLIDQFEHRGEVDAANEYARDIPVVVTTRMLGLPAEDHERFHEWTVQMLKEGAADFRARAEAVHAIHDYFARLVRSRAVEPDSGVFSFLLDRQAEDPSLTDDRIVGLSFLMLIAGIDTTWSALGAMLWHLATHPTDRRVLAADRTALPAAVDELLRLYAPVTIGRVVTAQATLGGRELRLGERVILPWAAANRDPEVFDHPDRFDLARDGRRHLAFGVGIHRCLGAHLALLEIRVAMDEWLRRIPEFTLACDQVEWTAGNTRGPKSLPLRISPALG
jgi:cytochrome P450